VRFPGVRLAAPERIAKAGSRRRLADRTDRHIGRRT